MVQLEITLIACKLLGGGAGAPEGGKSELPSTLHFFSADLQQWQERRTRNEIPPVQLLYVIPAFYW